MRTNGLAPEDPYQEYLIDSACELLMDIGVGMKKYMGLAKPEERDAALVKFCEEVLDPNMGYLENRLKQNSNQDFMVGDKISVADIMILNMHYLWKEYYKF